MGGEETNVKICIKYCKGELLFKMKLSLLPLFITTILCDRSEFMMDI